MKIVLVYDLAQYDFTLATVRTALEGRGHQSDH
jgi:hypothetical protein